MQTLKKASAKKESSKEEDKLKKASYNISTPRDYLQKTATTDIYGQNKKSSLLNAPRKSVGSSSGDKSSPMKPYLKSSSSTTSVASKITLDRKSKGDTSLIRKLNTSRESKTDSTRRSDKVIDSARRSDKVIDSTRRSDKVIDSAKRSISKAVTSTPESSRKLSKEPSNYALSVGTNRKIKDISTHKKSKETESGATPESVRKLRITKQNRTPELSRKSKAPETSRSVLGLQTNVTVNSPPMKKKNLNSEFKNVLERGDSKEIGDVRQRTKTRTLSDNEVKVLTPDTLDNNVGMKILSQRLSAKPKAFYVELDGDKKEPGESKKEKDKSSDEDYSYEDDFESYESDFESYHSSGASASERDNVDDNTSEGDERSDRNKDTSEKAKDRKDEEKMLDSGSFELRESQRSANKTKPGQMENIVEDSEDANDKKSSLTDEGFQETSEDSMKTDHVDVLDRPLFMDFTKSKENKRKKKANELLRQRAKDLLSLITLHEMSYCLFEMKPIPYEMYMATFGRSNYTQAAVQTYDDGVTEEVQTEEILSETKWTQQPVEFSKHDIYLNPKNRKKSAKNQEDYLSKFSILLNKEVDVDLKNKVNVEKDYRLNPLRIYFEQKDGVGPCEMLPYESYKKKVEDKDFNVARLSKFLKKVESRLSGIMNENKRDLDVFSTTQNNKLSFSKGYVTINPKTITNEQLFCVKNAKISKVFFSESRPHLLMTAHQPVSVGVNEKKCLICLWDINVARDEPLKVLVSIDNVTLARYRGDTDGIVVAALNDGSLHLWDLSEEPTWQYIASVEKSYSSVDIEQDKRTKSEVGLEGNLKNGIDKDGEKSQPRKSLHSCAYTSSAYEMNAGLIADPITGLELMTESGVLRDGGRKLIGQVCALQRIGKLIIWSIVQEKTKSNQDIGKAYWSKTKLEKLQIISLMDQFDIQNPTADDKHSFFNFVAAKRRLSGRRLEKKMIKLNSRPKSAVSYNSSEYDIDRPASAASVRSAVLPAEKSVLPTQVDVFSWESGVICNDLKVMRWSNLDNYLVAKNRGEVLICTRIAGTVRVQRFCVAKDMSSITCLDVSGHQLPYFLAATDAGTINLCSLTDSRVLLTLDCRNGPPVEPTERCQSDHLGRFVSSAGPAKAQSELNDDFKVKVSVASVHWSRCNPCVFHSVLQSGAALAYELTRSDICARALLPLRCVDSAHAVNSLALLTAEGEVQIHRLTNDKGNAHYLDLFQKYVALL